MKYSSKFILSTLLISILFSFNGCTGNSVTIVGKVNGENLSKSEFKYFLENTKTQLLKEAGINASDSDRQSKISEYWKVSSNKTKAKTKAYDNLVKFKLQYTNAKKNDFKLSKKDKDDFNSKFKEQYEGDVTFKSQLNEILGITLEKFKELTYKMFYVNKYEEQETKKINVKDSEIEDYYNKNKDKFDTTTVRHILFSTDQKTDKEKEEIKKKAEDILKKIKDGEDMAALAEKNSEDSGVIENKGLYEVKKDGKMVKAFEDWAVSAKVGDTGIIETYYGYQVMKCEKKSTFDTIKSAVKESVQKEKYLKKIEVEKNDKKNKIEKNQSEIDKVKFD